MKRVYSFVLLILLSVISNVASYSSNIIDISTGEKLNNIFLCWPIIRLFIEPFYSFAYYILTMERSGYVFALISWSVWIVLVTVLLCKSKKFGLKNTVISCVFSFFFFVSVICTVIIVPLPGPKISGTVIDGYKIVDIHSHTVCSRDNISSVTSNIKFHKKHGFTDFFITEHDNTKGYDRIPFDFDTKHIFPGIQIRTKEGVSVLLLSQKKFKYGDFKEKTIKEMTDLAHSKDMLVVMPHWWKWNYPSLQQLVNWGIDGFEIYNCGYRYISQKTRQEIIDVCNANNLFMAGTTDWHGLGYMTNVWTLVKEKNDKKVFELIKEKPKTKIVVHDVKGNQSILRYVFEPFYFLYNYSAYTPLKYVLSFYMFVFVVVSLLYKVPLLRIIRICSLFVAVFFSLCIFHFTYLLQYSFYENVMIPETVLPAAISLVIIWLIVWGFCDKDI